MRGPISTQAGPAKCSYSPDTASLVMGPGVVSQADSEPVIMLGLVKDG